MAPPPGRIWDVLGDVLGAVVARHGGDLPDRTYRSAGPPPYDCELLAVWCETTAGTDADPAVDANQSLRTHAAHVMRAATIVITLVRCVPAADLNEATGDVILPTVDEEETAAEVLYTDAQRVLNALIAEEKAGGLTSCNGLVFQSWTAVPADGGLVGGETRVRIGLATGL